MLLIMATSAWSILRPTLKKWPFWGPTCLLVVVALAQKYLLVNHAATPWKGGGFGMFSSADDVEHRFEKVFIQTRCGEIQVQTPPALSEIGLLARTIPSPTNLSSFGQHLTRLNWYVRHTKPLDTPFDPSDCDAFVSSMQSGAGVRALTTPSSAGADSKLPISAVRIEIWRTAIGNQGSELGSKLIRTATEITERS
jgi:hypothetical protein